MRQIILGCGDVGRRVVDQLIQAGLSKNEIVGYVNSSMAKAQVLGIVVEKFDLDRSFHNLSVCDQAQCYYTIAPQKNGLIDQRSRVLLKAFDAQGIQPNKVVLISTTGVYGDCGGEWVTEESPAQPQTERGQRRLDSEQQWLAWGARNKIDIVILRVPGIYAYSRLPRTRIDKAIPVVRASECGFTNRIHADDLAHACIQAMQGGEGGEVYNITDGTPGKISDYLQAAAQVLGAPTLAEISMQEARSKLSSGMLSYLAESRKISNRKMLEKLSVNLRYPDFLEGIKHG